MGYGWIEILNLT